MARVIPPWTYETRNGRPVVMLGHREYPVDPSRPPAFFFPSYLEAHLPTGWRRDQLALAEANRHPLANWLQDFDQFLERFEPRRPDGEYRDIIDAGARGAITVAYNMYSLEGDQNLQTALVERLIKREAFQGAMHELGVAATMVRANFQVVFEDESDSRRKHPEFVATHKQSGVRIAVEAKSIHRTGVLGFERGAPPPTLETADLHKIAAQICGQVERALPKADELPLYVFVDLNLPPAIPERFGIEWLQEVARILPQIDTGYDTNGIRVGKTMNLLTVTNWPMHLGEERHEEGDTLNGFLDTPAEYCRFPDGARHIDDVKAAVKQYGTFSAA